MTRKRQIQGLSWVLTARVAFAAAAWLLILAACVAPPALAGQDLTTEGGKAAEVMGTSDTAGQRSDKVFGTTDEGIRTGRDSDTGDTVIRVSPPEKRREPEYTLPPVLIEPKVEYPAAKKP